MDDSNVSDSEMLGKVILLKKEKIKRLKTDSNPLDKGDESNSKESSSSSTTDKENTASTSSSTSDSGFPKCCNVKNRNYRRSQDDDSSTNDSEHPGETESPIENNRLRDSPEISNESENSEMLNTFDSDSEDSNEPAVLKKQMPKHNWFIVPEVINRQIGHSAKQQSSQLFQRRSYGSLHCVRRLELMYKLEMHDGCVNSLNFHPDGSLLASGSDDLKVVIWDWKIGKPLLSFDTKHRGNVFQSKFLPLSGDLHVATCARDGQVRLAQVSKQEGLRSTRKLGSHRGPCHKLATLLDQPHVLLSAGEDGLVLSHDVRNPKPEKVVNVKQDDREVALYSISAHPLNTHEFCVSGRDHIVRAYDQRKCNGASPPLNVYYPDKEKDYDFVGIHVTCALYNHDGSEILASYNDDDIYIYDVNNSQPGKFIHQYQGHRNGATIKGVNFFGPKSEFIVSGSDCGNVYFWEKSTEAIVQWMLADDNGVVNCLEPHPQLPFICTSGLDWDVKVWVPSCEEDPTLNGLPEIIKANEKSRADILGASGDINESQMLWMLWRHLRSNSRIDRVAMNIEVGGRHDVPSSSSSNSSVNSDPGDLEHSSYDDDDYDGPSGCAMS